MLEGGEPITCRPADLLEPEVEKQTEELQQIAMDKGIHLADDLIDDVLTYALFPQMGIRFLENRGNPDAFEPMPTPQAAPASVSKQGASLYSVRVNGKSFTVEVAEGGALSDVRPVAASNKSAAAGEAVTAVLAGNIFKVHVLPGQNIAEGEPLLVVEAMKMETVVSAPRTGTVTDVFVAEGDVVAVGDPLVAIG